MPVKHIISYKNDGLGGRLSCMMNALVIAKYFECKISVVWKDNAHLSCDFNNLFRESELYEVGKNIRGLINQESDLCFVNNGFIKNYNNLMDFKLGYKEHRAKKESFKNEYVENNTKKSYANPVTINDMNIALLENDIVIFHSGKRFDKLYNIDYKDIFNNYLRPVDSIQSLIDSFMQINGFDNVLGVQVRRGDLTSSPWAAHRLILIERYFEKIDKLLISKKYEKIFLATESVAVISEFYNRYGNRLITCPVDDYSRSAEGIKQALIDLLLLSKCSLIVGGQTQICKAASRIDDINYIKLINK